jgi:hypothetical protein
MATSGLPNIVDWARSVSPDGSPAHIAQLLSQCNQMLKDMIWQEANMPLGHKITVGVSLPQGTFRAANIGVAFSKALNAQMQYGITELVSYSGVDRSIAELWGNVQKYRYQQDMAHIEGMSQQVSGALIYANEGTNPGQMTGFAPIYNTVNTASAYNATNVIDGGGTGSSNSSIYYVNWAIQLATAFSLKALRLVSYTKTKVTFALCMTLLEINLKVTLRSSVLNSACA